MADHPAPSEKPSLGGAIGTLTDAVFSRLPPGAGFGFAGVSAFFILWNQIPASFSGHPKAVIQWAFALGIICCAYAIVRGVLQRK